MFRVIGYASSTGSEELNQKLSEYRTHNVVIFFHWRTSSTPVVRRGFVGSARLGSGSSRQRSNGHRHQSHAQSDDQLHGYYSINVSKSIDPLIWQHRSRL